MNYEDSVGSLLALGRELAAPQQARVQKFGLENISALAADLGNPHRAVPCAHIAGTNGKGSTAAILESILRDAGLRTGLYTSPHLERINERIRLNGEPVSDEIFAAAWTRVHASIESLMASAKLVAHPTYFECVTAMAFLIFAEQRIDFAIYEVGLGGRLDSTNIVTPEVAIITPIDFDHENFLGHSIAEIAAEKAGIIKPGVTVVSSVTRPEARAVIAQKCAEIRARLLDIEEAWHLEERASSVGLYRAVATSKESGVKLTIAPALPGRFQLRNALAAATAAQVLSQSRAVFGSAMKISNAASQTCVGQAASSASPKTLPFISMAPTTPPALANFSNSGSAILPAVESSSFTGQCAIKRWTRSPACSFPTRTR